jgi:catechol 2,3-dioxygenase-like lactoylglutathione lyase family enzyme
MKVNFALRVLTVCALVPAAPAQEVARPRIIGVPHIAFRVHDIAASRHFYKDFLGYTEPFDINGPDGKLILAFIKINDRQYVELQMENSPDDPRAMQAGLGRPHGNAKSSRYEGAAERHFPPQKQPGLSDPGQARCRAGRVLARLAQNWSA